MPAAARRVRHLRLRADSAQAVRRVLPGFEDALRTATLPDSGGRLLLVRRLALGRIAADAAPASLALALERAVAAAHIDCVSATAPSAATASAVWFRDALEAHVALARRVLEGPPPNEWFWPLAVPDWSPSLGPEAAIAMLAASLDALPEAAVAKPAWVAALVGRGHREVLAAALGAHEVERLQAVHAGDVLDALPPIARTLAAAPSAPIAEPPPAANALVQSSRPVTGTVRPAAPPLSTPPSFDSPLPDQVASKPKPVSAPLEGSRNLPVGVSSAVEHPSATAKESAPATIAALPAKPQAVTSTASAAPEPDAQPAITATLPPAVVDSDTEVHIDGLPTAAGGIAFVLPVLARLGYPQWLEAHPERADAQIARRVLGLLLARLRVAEDDPAWALVGRCDTAIGPATGCTLPASWSALRLRHERRPLALEADVPVTDRQLAALWARAVHRWLRLHAQIGLADLIRRPALIALTPTHVDVRHDLRRVELRIRRAGLDLDPGWLPWFGRVVGFHYQRLE